LVDPAVNGTKNVLNAANRTESVTRVVLTSSCAAILGDVIDTSNAPRGMIDENDWNETSALDHIPYSFSKTLAEKAAWQIADAQSRWKMVVINPALITGPSLNGSPTSEVFSIIEQITSGQLKSGMPHIEVGVVDVRDVSTAHMMAGFIEDANGRNIIFNKTMSFLEIASAIKSKWPGLPVPTRAMPKLLVWLVGPMIDASLTRKWVSKNVGHPWRGDNSKAIRELGISYMPTEKSVQDMVQNMMDNGIIDAK
ncbi:MAG: NAD-dependent epimerase/dehydratase family protein, partial [Paracoccaceae bacterium]|nr:NAD-dependent epimerase/dehydratase family protein [Paracoccaceae bacterium]